MTPAVASAIRGVRDGKPFQGDLEAAIREGFVVFESFEATGNVASLTAEGAKVARWLGTVSYSRRPPNVHCGMGDHNVDPRLIAWALPRWPCITCVIDTQARIRRAREIQKVAR